MVLLFIGLILIWLVGAPYVSALAYGLIYSSGLVRLKQWKHWDLGNRWILIFLCTFLIPIVFHADFYGVLYFISLVGFYLVAVNTNIPPRKWFIWAWVAMVLSCKLLQHGASNYNLITGFTFLVLLLSQNKHLWVLLPLNTLLCCWLGSSEAAFTLGVITLFALARKDWSWKVIPSVALLVVGTWVTWQRGIIGLSVREDGYLSVIRNLSWVGHGWDYFNIWSHYVVHDVFLLITNQLGVVSLVWLGLSVYMVVRSKAKYLYVALLALTVFDHFIWTQVTPVWFILLGWSDKLNEKPIYRTNNNIVPLFMACYNEL